MMHNAVGCIAAGLFLAFGAVALGGAAYFALSALSPLLLVAVGAAVLGVLGVGLWAWLKMRPKPHANALGPVVVHVSNSASVSGSGNSQNTWR